MLPGFLVGSSPCWAWEKLASMHQARYDFAGALLDGQIYVFGGAKNNEDFSNTLESYHFALNDWYELPKNNGVRPPVSEVTGVALDGKLFVLGAAVLSEEGVWNYAFVYDPDSLTWLRFTDAQLGYDMPPQAANAPVLAYDGKIYRFGGENVNATNGEMYVRQEVDVFDPATGLWSVIAFLPYRLINPLVALIDDTAYIVGGATENGYSDNVLALDLSTGNWVNNGKSIGNIPSASSFMTGAAAPVINGRIYCTGGWNNPFEVPSYMVQMFDPAIRLGWVQLSTNEAIAAQMTIAREGALYIVGGKHLHSQGAGVNTVYKLDVDTDENGILDSQDVVNSEDVAIRDIDLNNDGVFDRDQPDVIKDAITSHDGVFGVCKRPPGSDQDDPNIISIDIMETLDAGLLPGDASLNFPLGMINFKLTTRAKGDTVTVTVYSSKDISGGNLWYKVDTINGWQDYSAHTTFIDRRTVVLVLKDGGFGDADGVANGVICDPSGPGVVIPPEPEPVPNPADYLAPSSNCFINSLR